MKKRININFYRIAEVADEKKRACLVMMKNTETKARRNIRRVFSPEYWRTNDAFHIN